MADHGFYLAMSYGVAALAIVAELVALRVGRARALKHIDEERDLETQD
jgi:heme exporter protein CcmD